MQVEIVCRELIKPSITTLPSLRNYKISLVDELSPTMNVPIIFYYPDNLHGSDKDNVSVNEDDLRCSILKKSLSKTLTRFYPLAGRYMKESYLVDCSDQGAEFVEAKVNISLDDLISERNDLNPDMLIDLLPCPIGALDEVTDPLVAVQVSVFACGGCTIGVCISHRVADISSVSTFINAWMVDTKQEVGQVEENYLPFSPKWNSPLLFPGKKLSALSFGISRAKETVREHKIITKMFFFSKNALSSLREKARLDIISGRLPSRVQSVFGIIGKAILDLHVANTEKLGRFLAFQPVNMRGRTDPQFSNNQIGNLYLITTVQSEANEGVEFHSLVDLLSDSVKRSVEDCKMILSLGDEGQMMVADCFVGLINTLSNPDIFCAGVFSDWTKFPFYEADFGWGKPVLVSVTIPCRNMVILIDKSGEGIEAWVSLHEHDMPKFQQDRNIMGFTA